MVEVGVAFAFAKFGHIRFRVGLGFALIMRSRVRDRLSIRLRRGMPNGGMPSRAGSQCCTGRGELHSKVHGAKHNEIAIAIEWGQGMDTDTRKNTDTHI